MNTTDAIKSFLNDKSDESFGILFKTFYRRLCRYFVLLKADEAVAEDLAQNVMLTVYQKADEVRDDNKFEGWLFAIARNAMLTHWRTQSRRPAETPPITDDLVNHPKTSQENNLQFEEWLSYLDSNDRELVIRRYIEGLSYEELASTLNLPIGTIKWKLFNIKKKLQPIIKQG